MPREGAVTSVFTGHPLDGGVSEGNRPNCPRNAIVCRSPAHSQATDATRRYDMIGHAVEPGVLNRYPPSCGLAEKRRNRVDRPVSRDDADRIVDRRKDRVECRIALGDELLPGRPETGDKEFFRRSAISLPLLGVPSITTRPDAAAGIFEIDRASNPPMEWPTKWIDRVAEVQRGEAGASIAPAFFETNAMSG